MLLASCASTPRLANEEIQANKVRFPASFQQFQENGGDYSALAVENKNFLASELYLKASQAMLHSNYQDADLYWAPLVKLSPDDTFIKRQYGVNLIALGRLSEASSIFSQLYQQSDYQDYALGLVLAGIYSAENRPKDSEDIYRQILKKDSGHEEACVYLSRSLVVAQKYAEAHRLLAKCEAKNKQAVFSYYRGKIELERKREDKAQVHFAKAVKIDPSYNQAVIGLGLIYENQGRTAEAISVYRNFIQKYGDQYSILSRLVYIYSNRNDNNELVDAMERLSTLDPTDINLKVRLGVVYTDLQRIDDAIASFKEILEEVPTSDKILYYLGALLVQKNSLDEAITYFERIPEDSSLFQEGKVQVARVLSNMASDEFKEGSERSEQRFLAYIKNTNDHFPHFAAPLSVILASYYDETGRTVDAIATLTPYLEGGALSSEDKYFMALLYDKDGKKDLSIDLLRKVVESDPENADVRNFLGYSLLEKGGNLDEAHIHIAKAVSLRPEDGYIRDSLGWYYYLTGNYAQAAIELQRAWELVQHDSVVAKHLAMAHEKMGNMKKANFFLKQAIVYCKEEKEKQSLMQALEQMESARLPASK